MKELLLINSCINRESSRTNRLSKELTKLLQENDNFETTTQLILEDENPQALNSKTLAKRLDLVKNGEFEHEMFRYAQQFMMADCIVIAAPYWDLGFPAMLKNYIENISVSGLTYVYNEQGRPVGKCKASTIYYVTTCGGFIRNLNLGFDTIKALSVLFGISECKCITAEGLDIQTNNVEQILQDAILHLPDSL
jgi:FMN-dependent NADH-azoreductase